MQLQLVGGFQAPLYQTRGMCYDKICSDKCHGESEIMLIAGTLSVCDLFIKSVILFVWSI